MRAARFALWTTCGAILAGVAVVWIWGVVAQVAYTAR